jgi:3alpha(or 20beta)-hydroxysteroid dehydrogenase
MAAGGRVAGKIVVVTGGARGQGAAEAAALAADGATVVAADVLERTDELPADIAFERLDVGDPESWSRLAGLLRDQHGRLDGLVNNAGITSRTRLGDIELAEAERVLRVNLIGPLLGIQAMAPLMPRGGSIVNIGSTAALSGHFPAAYTASKWGLRGLTRTAGMELGPRGIRVNIVHPGFIETGMSAAAGVPDWFRMQHDIAAPLGRAGTPQDIAPAIVFLMSDESSWISGAELAVDGGFSGPAGARMISGPFTQV